MKRLFALVLIALIAVSATACSGKSGSGSSAVTGTLPEQSASSAASSSVASVDAGGAAKPGSYIENGDYKFSFIKASLYDEVGDNEYLKQTPEDGKKYLVCFFEVENISAEDKYVNFLYFSAYLDDYDIDDTVLYNEVDGYSLLSGDLAAGKKMKGIITYEVNSDWKKLELKYTDGFSSDAPTYDFIVTPGDIS